MDSGKIASPPVSSAICVQAQPLLGAHCTRLVLEEPDDVDRHVEARSSVETSLKRDRAARVAAVGEDDQDRAAIGLGGAVEIHAERVVQRRLARRPCATRMRSTSRGKSCWREARDPDLGVEVHERHVHRVGQRVEEPDGGRCAPAAMSSPMLPLVSNSRPTCSSTAPSRRRRGRNSVTVCARAVLEHREIVRGQVRNRRPRRSRDGDADGDQVGSRRGIRGCWPRPATPAAQRPPCASTPRSRRAECRSPRRCGTSARIAPDPTPPAGAGESGV